MLIPDRKLSWVIATLSVIAAGTGALANDAATSETTGSSAGIFEHELSELIQKPPATANSQQHDRFESFAEAVANEAFTEAEISAKYMVEQIGSKESGDAAARARALHNLAVAQQLNGNLDSAIQNYTAAVDVIVAEGDNLDPALILPLRGLAVSIQDAERPDEAFAALSRAQHVSDVNFGPHSFKQLPILHAQIRMHLDNDDQAAALELLDRIQTLYSRVYARTAEEMLPALYQRAEVYRKLAMHSSEFRAWRHILEIKESHLAENDLALIEPHLKLAATHTRDLRQIGYRAVTTSPAELHLKKALQIAENSSDDNWQARKDCLIAMADFYTVFDMKGRARRYYKSAWELLSSDERSLATRAELMEKPVPLAQGKPDPYANFEYRRDSDKIDPDDYETGEIVIGFTINDRGRPKDLQVISANPPNFSHMEKRVRNAVERFVYRPRYAHGQPTATVDLRYRTEYFYHPDDYAASLSQSDRRGGVQRKKKR